MYLSSTVGARRCEEVIVVLSCTARHTQRSTCDIAIPYSKPRKPHTLRTLHCTPSRTAYLRLTRSALSPLPARPAKRSRRDRGDNETIYGYIIYITSYTTPHIPHSRACFVWDTCCSRKNQRKNREGSTEAFYGQTARYMPLIRGSPTPERFFAQQLQGIKGGCPFLTLADTYGNLRLPQNRGAGTLFYNVYSIG